jgi:cyanophycinase
VTHRPAWLSLPCLLLCGACGLLLEENTRFSAGAAETEEEEEEEDDDTETDPDLPPTDDEGIPKYEPPRPDWLEVYTLGNEADANVHPDGPGLLLVGGGSPGDAAYQWQADMIAGGDVVVLQSQGEPLLHEYLYNTIGGVDSVQTIIVPPGAASFEPWIAWTVAHAEAVLIAGSDPYPLFWKGTPIEAAIMVVWNRDGVVGGVESGLSLLGEFVYPRYGDHEVSSGEALADPYDEDVMLERNYLALAPLEDTLIEPEFANEDRMGRLLVFGARVLQDRWSDTFVGLGIDDHTAMLIGPDGVGEVSGSGHAYVFRTTQRPAVCVPEDLLEFGPVMVARLSAGDTVSWPGGETSVATSQVTATNGWIDPANPY